MREIAAILDEIYAGHSRLGRQDIVKRAVDLGAPVDVVNVLFHIPDGTYARDQAEQLANRGTDEESRVPASGLSDVDLMRELAHLHVTRHGTLRHGSDHALEQHTRRMAEMEEEYLRRNPDREIEPERLRAGARAR